MQRSTHLTKRGGRASKGLRGSRAPVPQPTLTSGGLAENGEQTQSGGQVSWITMTLFVAGGIGFMYWVSQEPNRVVAPAPGPAV